MRIHGHFWGRKCQGQWYEGGLKNGKQGFPGGAVVGNLPANAGDTGSHPGLGGSHMPQSNLGPWATTAEPVRLEPVLRNKRGHDSERPAHHDEEWPPLAATRESPGTETKTQHSNQSINQSINKSLKKKKENTLSLHSLMFLTAWDNESRQCMENWYALGDFLRTWVELVESCLLVGENYLITLHFCGSSNSIIYLFEHLHLIYFIDTHTL